MLGAAKQWSVMDNTVRSYKEKVKDLVNKYSDLCKINAGDFANEWESQVRTGITSKDLSGKLLTLYHYTRGHFQYELASINNKIMMHENPNNKLCDFPKDKVRK